MPGAIPVPARIGPITTSGLTIATARLAGRTTASTGAIEEISVSGATLSGGVLTISAAAAGTLTGTTLAANVVTSSLTTVGTLIGGATGAGFTIAFGASTMTGTVPVANGGTAIASYAVGDLLQATGATTLTKLAAVATGNVLLSGGVTTASTWGKVTTSHTTGIAASGANADLTSISGLTGTVTQTRTNGTSITDALLIQNTTAAAAGAQQISGSISQTGQGWAVSGSSNQTARFRQWVVPIQSAGSTITATWNLASTIGAGAENIRVTITDAGAMTLAAGLSATSGAFTGAITNSAAGAASTPAVVISGVPFAGTGTTSFPLLYINDATATASTTLNTAGTYFGVNGHGTADLIQLMLDGVQKLKVTSGGNITAGSATFGGALTISNGAFVATPQALSGAGAVNITQLSTAYTSTGTGEALTLANGANGQVKIISHVVKGTLGTGILTPTTKAGYTTITFNNAGDSVTLQFFTTAGWVVIGSFGVVIA